jgi:serine/threonine-protein kinase RIO1
MTQDDGPELLVPKERSAFRVTACQLEWFVWTDIPVRLAAGAEHDPQLLRPTTAHLGSPPISWDVFRWPDATGFSLYSLAPAAREELKACVRRRQHIKGNTAQAVFRFGGDHVGFETLVVVYRDRTCWLIIQTAPLSLSLSADNLIRLTSIPSVPTEGVAIAASKTLQMLAHRDSDARPRVTPHLNWYPYVHIYDYTPRSHERQIEQDVPWSELAVIGTRHRRIEEQHKLLVGTYRAKNHSIRGEVTVVDKQSTLVVASHDYLELQGIRYCLLVARRMAQLLKAAFAREPGCAVEARALDLLAKSERSPSLVTDSANYRILWPLIARECQALEWAQNLGKGEVPSAAETVEGPSSRYTDFKRLSAGAYADVWNALDSKLSRRVALRILRTSTGDSQDPVKYARALARLQNRHIVAVHDVVAVTDPESGQAVQAVVMELLSGNTLKSVLKGPVLSKDDVARIGLAILEAVSAYHAANLAHTDLHSENVLVGQDFVKVIDPLYLGSAFSSTAMKRDLQRRDVWEVRFLLRQLVEHSAIVSSVSEFDQARDVDDIAALASAFGMILQKHAKVPQL